MKRQFILLLLALSLMLTGCGWLDGSYVHVTPHQEQGDKPQLDTVSASNYVELRQALEEMITEGTEDGVILLTDFDRQEAETNMRILSRYLREGFPVGAYAVESFDYEIGANSGKPAIAISVNYRHSPMELRQIKQVYNMEQAAKAVGAALERIDSGLVLMVEHFVEEDFTQMVHTYARSHPDSIMELPQVTEAFYGAGESRVVELKFVYLTSRDGLRQMRSQVQSVFEAAELYVTEDAPDRQKFSQLYSFLMERFDYRIETSITPTYSLLHHGVGDSKAFALTFAAMCSNAGLRCQIVTGTRDGQPWTWNMVQEGESWYHVDLLRCSSSGGYRQKLDREMGGYVWDYSAYPACNGGPVQETTEETEPAEIGATEK